MITEDQILEGVLGVEGPKDDDQDDHGGYTVWGVTRKVYAEYLRRPVTLVELKALTREQAKEVHREIAIARPGFRGIKNDLVRAFVVDMAVLEGPVQAACILQRCVGVRRVDGKFGPLTATAVNATDPWKALRALIVEREHHLLNCAVVDVPDEIVEHSNLKFRHGWWNRVAGFLP